MTPRQYRKAQEALAAAWPRTIAREFRPKPPRKPLEIARSPVLDQLHAALVEPQDTRALCALTGLTSQAVLYHLKTLQREGLVEVTRSGRAFTYRRTDAPAIAGAA